MRNAREWRGWILPSGGVVVFCLLLMAGKPDAATTGDPERGLYFYSEGKKVPLTVSTERIAVRFSSSATLAQRQALVQSRGDFGAFAERVEDEGYEMTLLPLKVGLTGEGLRETIDFMERRGEVLFSGPVFELPNGVMVLTDEMSVQFRADATEDEIAALNLEYGVEVVRKVSRRRPWYLLRVENPKGMRCLNVANAYHDNPLTEFSLPRFMLHIQAAAALTPGDTYFNDQWPLDSIDAPEGWAMSIGDSDIVIAIIDTGVDLEHEDLEDILVDGYDTDEHDSDPSPETAYEGDGHGTSCAGLAAAETDNDTGVAGVAWGCKIMPIRVAHSIGGGSWSTDNTKLAEGIQWASDNGADVLSNSWYILTNYQDVLAAIQDAKNNGRDGKGCVVLAGAGNDSGAINGYPALYNEVITVGATDDDDVRWGYSNYGAGLDVVAPSGSAHLQQPDVIMWTTDISGQGGYNPGNVDYGDAAGNYDKWMGGTSGATPEVAGLAALILSMNPDFTSNEVQYIIESTADDLGDTGRDNLYGWGRINLDSTLTWVSPFALEDQLKHWWKLDETSGTTAEDSIGSNTGVVYGAQWTTGQIDGGLRFDGSDDYVYLGKLNVLKDRVATITAWIKPTDTDRAWSPIVTQYYYDYDLGLHHGYYLCLSGKKAAFYLDAPAAESGDVAEEGEWCHIAGTYDSKRLKIYVNGVLNGTYDYDADDRSRDADAHIGHDTTTADNWFQGIIDDVRVYSWAMDVDEILDKMYCGTSKFSILDASGVRVAWFDDLGNLFLKGSLTEGGGASRPSATADDEFILQDSTGNVAVINAASGDMSIYGSVQQTWADPPGGSDDFIITNSNNQPVAYIDDSGDLYLKGELYEQPE